MKKSIICLLALTLILSSTLGFASTSCTASTLNQEVESQEIGLNEQSKEVKIGQETDLNAMAKSLNNLGILTGTNKGYELERELTRAEGSTIVTRLAIDNDHKLYELTNNINIPFTDVPEWADEYVKYLYQEGAVNGISDKLFGSNDKMTAQQFTTMVLRLLGYSDNDEDFVWDKSLDKALDIGMIDKENKERIEKAETFTRGDMVLIAYNALFQGFKNDNQKLLALQATTETAKGLTQLFSIDLTDAEVEEIKRADRTWEDKFFGNDNEKYKAFEDKILNSVRQALDYYEVYYDGTKYDVNVDKIITVQEYNFNWNWLSLSLEVFVNNGVDIGKANMDMLYKLEKNKLIPWSDSNLMQNIAGTVVMNISMDKHGYKYGDKEIRGYSKYVDENPTDSLVGIEYKGDELEPYLVPFNNGNYKIIIQDYK